MFQTMTVGAGTFRNTRLSVQDATLLGTDMLLGMDFLRWRKLWISYSTNQVFIQYTPRRTAVLSNIAPAATAPSVSSSTPAQAPGTRPVSRALNGGQHADAILNDDADDSFENHYLGPG